MGELGPTFALLASIVFIVGAVLGTWIRYGLPRWRRMTRKVDAALESVVGREAVVDPASGRTLAPAVPGIGVRMANLEDSVTLLVEQRARLDDHDHRIGQVEQAVAVNAAEIRKLHGASVERIVTKAESSAAWRAVEAIANGNSHDAVGDTEDNEETTP